MDICISLIDLAFGASILFVLGAFFGTGDCKKRLFNRDENKKKTKMKL